ncbi:hypothetical protein SPSIL_058300 [Sporomusa silvacetica DSM 10669]|uniref:Short-chain dehydrogenase n=1 Tax=Sporomusa silvacetica DSM 10669 TaxID=1123289 RepID=A0ABZ3IV41_9FIRM|nr:hypothetical protein [Sporomusa silvacetica]OZC14222.1 hypothetical protein SPSIL_49490 [Sporomusa silvacetica DSM 10669]
MDLDLQLLCVNARMYQRFEFNKPSDKIEFADMLFNGGSIRTYCPACEDESIFKIDPYLVRIPRPKVAGYVNSDYNLEQFNSILDDIYINLIAKCASNQNHTAAFNFYITSDYIIKTGQHPSYTDLTKHDFKKYRRILGDDKYKEFNRAIGLASSDIGIGAFVYLRRIFEHILEQAHLEAKSSSNWDETSYSGKKVHDKILCLKNFLPQFLIDNAAAYSILSKGIHELSENECITYFPVVRSAIELILDDVLAKEEYKRKSEETAKEIQKLNSILKSK